MTMMYGSVGSSGIDAMNFYVAFYFKANSSVSYNLANVLILLSK